MMHWHTKVPPCLLVVLCLGLVAFGTSSADSSDFLCNPTDPKTIDVHTGSDDAYKVLTVGNLTVGGSCRWNISQQAANSYLDLTSITLDAKDSLTIVGTRSGGANSTNVTRTLFQSTGTPLHGAVNLAGYNLVLVTLNLTAASVTHRAFYTVYYWRPTVHLQTAEGELTFPLNTDKSPLVGQKLELTAGAQFDDQLVLLNFTQLPSNSSSKVTVDGTPLTATSSRIFLQSKTTVTIAYDLPQAVEPITIRWWLVSRQCSEQAVLKTTDKARPILSPDSAARKVSQQAPVRCAMAYSTDAGSKFVVHVPSPSGLANPGDSVNFIDGSGSIALGLNGPAVMYFSTVDTLIESASALVLYESPYASGSPNPAYKAPEIRAIPSTQASEIILTKDTPVEVKFSPTEETVHLVISLDKSKHVQIVFPQGVTLKPGDLEIKLFNSESSSGTVPIATLGQYTRLPAAIVSGGQMLRATFKGKQPATSAFTVTYRLVDANSTCGRLSTLTANFEVRGGEGEGGTSGPCTWFIPESSAASSVVLSPAAIKLPAGKALTLTDFNDPTGKPFSLTGPFSGSFFPDLVLTSGGKASSTSAYELTVDSANVTAESKSLHVLITAKADSFIARNSSYSVAEQVSSVSSINYPGAYPVGAPLLTESWNFMGDASQWALVTFEDIQLAKSHTLFLTADTAPINFSGEANMTVVPDFLVKRPFFLTQEVNSNLNLTSEAKRGFKASLRYPGVADSLAIDKETKLVFNATAFANVTSKLAIWHLTAGKAGQPQGDTILHVNVTLAEGLVKSKASLALYDSISLRPASLHLANGSFSEGETEGHFLGSIRSLWIVYDYSAVSDISKANLSASFVITPEQCTNKNYTLKRCATADRCITDLMACNGINECGDYSDELYCKGGSPPSPPAPPTPASSGGGVNTLVVIFLLMPMSAILGIVGYIYLPQFLMRIRRGRYSEFRDLSEVS